MASNELEANLHCNSQDTFEVSTLGHHLLTEGAYANAEDFPDIKISSEVFEDDLNLLDKLEAETKDSHKAVPLRDSQRKKVYKNIKVIFYYVKPICGNNIDLITKSGFAKNLLTEKSPIPDAPSILRIVRGKEPDTYKVFILRKTNKSATKKHIYKRRIRITYTIELSLAPEIESSWIIVLEGMSSLKLNFEKYTPLVKNYIRIYGRTATGRGQASAVFSFIPE
ncbi:MAG: hypothetical protein WCL51_07630 [Bacteroidota bacterium]